MITQPENLSKDRLKAELKKKGIPHSPGRTKEYYVKIYQDSVLGGSVGIGRRLRPRSEFSSDEETISKRLVSKANIYLLLKLIVYNRVSNSQKLVESSTLKF